MQSSNALLQLTESGLYCPAGDFYIDPWKPVERAIITHGHSDHCRWGMERYLTAEPGLQVLRTRLGNDAKIDTVPYGEKLTVNGVKVSLHPAGHLLGSAQVRIEDGQTWVVTGDYKTEHDPTCAPFELQKCHGFVTESTFGLPIYRWKPDREVFDGIDAWWAANQAEGKCSVLTGYSLGKAQRLLAGVGQLGPIVVHGAIARMNEAYRWAGVPLPKVQTTHELKRGFDFGQALVVAPPGATATPWIRRFGETSTAFASGWMAIRGIRRRMSIDRGFVLSDHVDWPSLHATIDATGAEDVWVTHGYAPQVVRYLTEHGKNAKVLPTRFTGEEAEAAPDDKELAIEGPPTKGEA